MVGMVCRSRTHCTHHFKFVDHKRIHHIHRLEEVGDCVEVGGVDHLGGPGRLAGEAIDIRFTNCLFQNNNWAVPGVVS